MQSPVNHDEYERSPERHLTESEMSRTNLSVYDTNGG